MIGGYQTALMGVIAGGKRRGDDLAGSRLILFHGDGANGSTDFTESSLDARTPTQVVGSPIIESDSGAFGGAAFRYYRGNSSYIVYERAGGWFPSQEWTLEFIFEMVENTTGTGSGTDYNTVIGTDDGGSGFVRIVGATPNSLTLFGVDYARSAGRNFVRICRTAAGVAHWYINGSRVYTGSPFTQPNNRTKLIVGCINSVVPGSSDWSHGARIEELRITEGIALSTGASYALQTTAWPDP